MATTAELIEGLVSRVEALISTGEQVLDRLQNLCMTFATSVVRCIRPQERKTERLRRHPPLIRASICGLIRGKGHRWRRKMISTAPGLFWELGAGRFFSITVWEIHRISYL